MRILPVTRSQFDAKFASACDDFNARTDAATINDAVFAEVAEFNFDDELPIDRWLSDRVKSAYERLAS